MKNRLTVVQVLAVIVTAVVFACAMILSYSGLREWAHTAGKMESHAKLFPIMVDGMILGGSLLAIAQRKGLPRAFAWLIVVTGSGISLFGNVALAKSTQEMIVHSIAPIALVLTMEAGLLTFKRSSDDRAAAAKAAQDAADREEKRAQKQAEKAASPTPHQRPSAPRTRPAKASSGQSSKIPPEVVKEALRMRDVERISGNDIAKHFKEFAGRSTWQDELKKHPKPRDPDTEPASPATEEVAA